MTSFLSSKLTPRLTLPRPNRCVQDPETPVAFFFVALAAHWLELTRRLSAQLHFIESYLRESNPGFDNLSDEDQMRVKEELYVEVNRWARTDDTVTVQDSTTDFKRASNGVTVSLNAGSPWHPTSFGACGQSSRHGSPPSNLGTWWANVLLLHGCRCSRYRKPVTTWRIWYDMIRAKQIVRFEIKVRNM